MIASLAGQRYLRNRSLCGTEMISLVAPFSTRKIVTLPPRAVLGVILASSKTSWIKLAQASNSWRPPSHPDAYCTINSMMFEFGAAEKGLERARAVGRSKEKTRRLLSIY
jgi:hypothetical protein